MPTPKRTKHQKRRRPAKANQHSAPVPTFTQPPTPTPADPPSLTQTQTLLAQIHLHDAEDELAALRKTLRQHRAALKELRKSGALTTGFFDDLLVALDRRDRRLSTRLAKVQDTVTNALHLLASANDIALIPANN
jgi:hypothetical protein